MYIESKYHIFLRKRVNMNWQSVKGLGEKSRTFSKTERMLQMESI